MKFLVIPYGVRPQKAVSLHHPSHGWLRDGDDSGSTIFGDQPWSPTTTKPPNKTPWYIMYSHGFPQYFPWVLGIPSILPSGNLLQFAIEHGPVEIVSFPMNNGHLEWLFPRIAWWFSSSLCESSPECSSPGRSGRRRGTPRERRQRSPNLSDTLEIARGVAYEHSRGESCRGPALRSDGGCHGKTGQSYWTWPFIVDLCWFTRDLWLINGY